MNKLMTLITTVALLAASAVSVSAQGGYEVKGIVVDALGPVIGATVIEKGTVNGASTGLDGDYILKVASLYLARTSLDINALSAGDDVASNLGVDVQKLRRNGLIVCTLVTASCLSFTGVIGFIGLMAPHLCRMMIGNDSRYLLPASGLMGIAILAISDLFCRMIIRPGELPVGIVLYIVGGIFFIWMIGNKKWRQRV